MSQPLSSTPLVSAATTRSRTLVLTSLLVAVSFSAPNCVTSFVPSTASNAYTRREATGRILGGGSVPLEAVGGDDNEPELILGSGGGVGGVESSDYLSEYQAASAKRNEEAKRKLMEATAREEEEARARAKAREEGEGAVPQERNYGPGDLSPLPSVLTNDETSWEASLTDDDSGVMGGAVTGESGGEGGSGGEDGPGLYVPGDEDDGPGLYIPTESGDGDGDGPILL
mmetsp:Transcript_11154/g.24147  ORF Transcript_11154/g.24147 Transcript_11154/m.24147 type:complete len:228 (-) Transcript_11154:183-866(-)